MNNMCSRASRRILLGSVKKLQIDDYIMLFVTVRGLVPPKASIHPVSVGLGPSASHDIHLTASTFVRILTRSYC